MAQERLSMRKLKEVLRLKWGCGLANHVVARSCRVSSSSVSEYVNRARAAGLSWPLPEDLDDAALWAKLFPTPERPADEPIPEPDWSAVHKEMQRKGVTRQLLWREYRQAHSNGYGYSRFCEIYAAWRGQLSPTMRQTHQAGEGMVDYAGLTMPVMDPVTREIREAQVFVYSLAASNYIYAEGQWAQDLPNWLAGHARTFEALGGVPPLTRNDNLKAGVTHPCRYDPDLNKTYHDFALHYGTAVVPTRVVKPRDKAKVESAVLVVERDVLAPLRNVLFIGLAAFNEAIAERLHLINHRPLRHIGQSRQELLESIDRPALLPLPEHAFELANWKLAKVAIDYHVEFDHHFYSVPYRLIRQQVDIRATAQVIEVFAAGLRVASHCRSHQRGRHTTDHDHMPAGHRAYAEWTPERLTRWAAEVGPQTASLVAAIMASREHPEQGFRASLGVMRLADRYSAERLEAACGYALQAGITRYKSIKQILDAKLDQTTPADLADQALPAHANVRGAEYFR